MDNTGLTERSLAVTGAPRWILQAEALVVLGVSAVAYAQTGYGWGLFALLLLVPDGFMLGYLSGNRLGAWVYNFGHTYTVPVLIGGVALWAGAMGWLAVALIWVAHIAADRAMGFGLKYPSGFKHSHLNWR